MRSLRLTGRADLESRLGSKEQVDRMQRALI